MPDWKEEIARRLQALNLSPTREAEIVEEVAQHLEDRYRELVSGGSKEDEARRLALNELSDECLLAKGLRAVEQEAPQEPAVPGGGGGNNFLGSTWQDLRYGLRQLRRNPGFTACGHSNSCPRNWREHRHLFRDRRRSFASARLSASRSTGCIQKRSGLSNVRPRLSRLAAPKSDLLQHGALHRRGKRTT